MLLPTEAVWLEHAKTQRRERDSSSSAEDSKKSVQPCQVLFPIHPYDLALNCAAVLLGRYQMV